MPRLVHKGLRVFLGEGFGLNGWGVSVITRLHLVMGLGISGALPYLTLIVEGRWWAVKKVNGWEKENGRNTKNKREINYSSPSAV